MTSIFWKVVIKAYQTGGRVNMRRIKVVWRCTCEEAQGNTVVEECGCGQSWKNLPAYQQVLGNILDGWGTFWTKIYAVLSHFTVCRKLRIFHKVFKVKMGTLSPKKGVMTHWWSKYLRYNHYTMYIIKIWMKLYHKSWFTHICRYFWKYLFHAFWGTFWNPQSLPGEHKGTFFMSV